VVALLVHPATGFAQGHQNAIIGRGAPLRKKHLPRLGDTRVGRGDRVSSDDPSSASTPITCKDVRARQHLHTPDTYSHVIEGMDGGLGARWTTPRVAV